VSAKRDGAAIVGGGAAACVVCCAGPILGFLAPIGLATAAGFALFSVVGLVIGLAVGLVLYRRRRQRRSTCAPLAEVVHVAPTRMRASR
jgi:hypothetical protein